jgi:excinuclease ABC subunit B
VNIRPARTQVDDLVGEVRATAQAGYRSLITVLTKRMAEDLTEYLHEQGIRVRYMPRISTRSAHRDHPRPAPRRVRRAGRHQFVARRPRHSECALVAILDADKEGFAARPR